MRKYKLYGMALLTALSVLFQGCDDDEGYSIGDLGADWVTVHVKGDGVYSFTGDHWGTMWAVASSIFGYRGNEGDRAVLYFNPLQKGYQDYDYAIKPEFIKPILTKPVEDITEADEEEYGDDPAYVNDAWVAGGYLNMTFTQKLPASKKHRVSLVRSRKDNSDGSSQTDGYVHLEYRYNTYGDTLNQAVSGAVCYNLSTLKSELETAKGIKLRIRSAVNGYRTLTFEKNSSGSSKRLDDLDFSEMKVE